MPHDAVLTARKIARLCAVLPLLGRTGICDSQIEALRSLVLSPSLELWNMHYLTPADSRHTMSLWQAVCLTSPHFQHVVALDEHDVRHWIQAPDSEMILEALEFALL